MGLELALMVASSLMGSCKLLLFFSVHLLLCYMHYNLPLLVIAHLAYVPFSLGYPSFLLLVLVHFWCNIIEISPCYLMDPWYFSHMPGLVFDSLWSMVLCICIGSAVVAVVSCPLILVIFLSYPLGVSGDIIMFSPSLGTKMRVHMRVGVMGKDWSFRFLFTVKLPGS